MKNAALKNMIEQIYCSNIDLKTTLDRDKEKIDKTRRIKWESTLKKHQKQNDELE
jgi:hypothetical protein